MTKDILFFDFKRKYRQNRNAIQRAISSVFERGWFILGPELERFEHNFAQYLKVPYAVGVNSGTDALYLALRALGVGKGDEVITVSHTATPTISAIRLTGAIPVFVDIDADTYNMDVRKIEPKITSRTKVILPVHLYGYPADPAAIMRVAKKHGLKVVEDAAQATGAYYRGKLAGTIGDIGCFSFYPTKNLGAFGDGGAIATRDKKLADTVRALRNYGEVSKFNNRIEGTNSRLDELQASLLSWSLTKLKGWNKKRERLASLYLKELRGLPLKLPPAKGAGKVPAWHLFVIRTARQEECDALRKFLAERGVGTMVHYPTPVFAQKAYSFLHYTSKDLPVTSAVATTIVSLPLYPELTVIEVKTVCRNIKLFYDRHYGRKR